MTLWHQMCDRERAIARLKLDFHNGREIAQALGLSVQAVHITWYRMRHRLGLPSDQRRNAQILRTLKQQLQSYEDDVRWQKELRALRQSLDAQHAPTEAHP